MKFKIQPIDSINLTKKYFYHFENNLPELEQSIKNYGIINPVIVAGDSIIDGHRRTGAAKEAGIKEIPVYQETTDNLPNAFLSGLHLNAFNRKLSLVEKLKAFSIASDSFQQQDINKVKKLLEFKHFPQIDKITQKVLNLPYWLQFYFHRIHVKMKLLEILLQYPVKDYETWFKFGDEFNLKAPEISKLLEQVMDICMRDDIQPGELWKSLGIQKILASGMTAQQNVHRVKEIVHAKRNPILVHIQNNLTDQTRKITKKFSGNLQIQWDATLERPDILLQWRIKNTESLKQNLVIFKQDEFESDIISILKTMNRLPEEMQ